MKHLLRIVISLLVVTVIGLGVWYFAFRPDSDLSTFNQLTSINSYEKQLGTTANISSLQSESNIASDSATLSAVHSTFGAGENADNSNYSPYTIYKYARLTYDYYYPYTQMANKVKSSVQKSINSKLKNYKNDLSNFSSTLTSAVEYKDGSIYADGTSAAKAELKARVENVKTNLVELNKSLTELNIILKSFVNTYAFGGNMIVDNKTGIYDMLNTSIYYHYNSEVTEHKDFMQLLFGKYATNGASLLYKTATSFTAFVDLYENSNNDETRLLDLLFNLSSSQYDQVKESTASADAVFGLNHGAHAAEIISLIEGA